ncbi:MAG: co-chaperone GroES [Candidatus Hodarchaeales archaeon]|jgi:chaperonin GroES
MIKPLKDKILIKADKDKEESTGGILIPEGSKEDVHKWGTVVAVGTGRVSRKGKRIPLEVRVGDRVLYVFALEKTETGKSIKAYVEEDQFLISESDVVAFDISNRPLEVSINSSLFSVDDKTGKITYL